MKKLTFSLLFVVLASAIGLGWTLDSLFHQIDSENQPQGSSELLAYHQVGKALAQTLDNQPDPQRFIRAWQSDDTLSVSLLPLSELPLPRELETSFTQGQPLELESEQHILIHYLLPSKQQALVLSLPKTSEQANASNLQLVLTSIFYLGILAVVVIWLYPLITHLQRLSKTAKALGEGQLSQRVEVTRTSYIAGIEIEFNRMAQRIETLVSDNKLLGNAVSHDLRTPLARLRFGIEALQQTDNPDNREKYQARISRDIEEMEKLVAVLLDYARMEQSMVKVERMAIDMNRLVSQCVELHSDINITISWQSGDEMLIQGNEYYLAMLLNNLIDNALQYAQKQVDIKLEQQGNFVSLVVADDGCGIPEDKRELVLQPFSRGDNPSQISGYGMGLAIVARIAEWHNATLSINDSAQLGGAEFELLFKQLPAT